VESVALCPESIGVGATVMPGAASAESTVTVLAPLLAVTVGLPTEESVTTMQKSRFDSRETAENAALPETSGERVWTTVVSELQVNDAPEYNVAM
jgi:hypothetical protein